MELNQINPYQGGMPNGSDQLTEHQKVCLRYVLTHHSSKEIAALLGISPSAVDKRIERAVQILSATSRFDAARRLASAEGTWTSDPLPCDPIDVPEPTSPEPDPIRDEPWGFVPRLVGSPPRGRTPELVRNPLSVPRRMAVILGMVLAIATASLVLVSLASTLTHLVKSMRDDAGG